MAPLSRPQITALKAQPDSTTALDWSLPSSFYDGWKGAIFLPTAGQNIQMDHEKAYNKIAYIGKGGQGCVNLFKKKSNVQTEGPELLIVKTCKIQRQWLSGMSRLQKSLKELQAQRTHTAVAEADYLLYQDTMYLKMEYCNGGNLKEFYCYHYAGEIWVPESFIWHVFASISSALSYLHHGEVCIIHGDIKPDNIMIHQSPMNPDIFPEIRLIDFDLGVVLDNPKCYCISVNGSDKYQPPEQIMDGICTSKADVYALGGVIQYLAGFGSPGHDYYKEPERRGYPTVYDISSNYTNPLNIYMRKALEPKMVKRITSRALCEYVCHWDEVWQIRVRNGSADGFSNRHAFDYDGTIACSFSETLQEEDRNRAESEQDRSW